MKFNIQQDKKFREDSEETRHQGADLFREEKGRYNLCHPQSILLGCGGGEGGVCGLWDGTEICVKRPLTLLYSVVET